MEALKVNYVQLRRATADGVAVIPMGSLEAHGPHLPCGADSLIVEGIVARAVDASDPKRVVVLPTVRYSVVEWARPFASVGLSPMTLLSKLVDVARDVHRLVFRRIVFVQGHGNLPAAQMAIWQLRHEGVYALYVDVSPYLMAADRVRELAGEGVLHGGAVETSLVLALLPDQVDMSAAVEKISKDYHEEFIFKRFLHDKWVEIMRAAGENEDSATV